MLTHMGRLPARPHQSEQSRRAPGARGRKHLQDLPTGIITLLFTDIEGSTRLWEIYPDAMPAAMARHDAILRVAIEDEGGVVFRTVGDAFFAAFERVERALAAALRSQLGLYREPWDALGLPCARAGAWRDVPMRVRMALHTSAVDARDGEYFGPPLNRVARLLSAAHGGQTLLCGETADRMGGALPAGTALRELGEHRLRDLQQPLRIYQLLADELPADFPPLKTLTAAKGRPPGDAPLRQAKLPGMPQVDYDALWRREKERERLRKKPKQKKDEGGFF